MIFYKNSLILNEYSRLKFFIYLLLKLILTFPNCQVGAKQVPNNFEQSEWPILFTQYVIANPMWSKISGRRRDRRSFKWTKSTWLFTFISLLFFFTTQYDKCFWRIHRPTVQRLDSVQCTKWAHKGCSMYRGFGGYFCDNCRHWFWFF